MNGWGIVPGVNATNVAGYYPNAHVFLCNMTNIHHRTGLTGVNTQAQINAINLGINEVNSEVLPNVVAASGGKITLVNINSVINPSIHLVDGVHPNSVGEGLIAYQIYLAMLNYYNW